MRVLLICLSVIMVMHSTISPSFAFDNFTEIKDLTDWCTNNNVIYNFLTFGAGINDRVVAMIANENNIDCSIMYTVKEKYFIMLVLQFPDMKPKESICVNYHNNSILIGDPSEDKSCTETLKVKNMYSKLIKKKIMVNFLNVSNMTVQIIATAMRDARGSKCSHSEVECVVRDKLYCMTEKTACDGYINCGAPGLFDENLRKCKGPVLSIITTFLGLLQVIVIIFLIISIAMSLVPTPRETFIYRFDQEMSLFDGENGILTVEIEIKILFPDQGTVKLKNVDHQIQFDLNN